MNGCHNRKPYKDFFAVKDGHTVKADDDLYVAHQNVRAIEFRMSRDCQYTKTDLGQADAGCVGCKWRMN